MTTKYNLKLRVKSGSDECSRFKQQLKNPNLSRFQRSTLEQEYRTIIKSDARCMNLAYGFLRGRTYTEIERDAKTAPDWERVFEFVNRYGARYYKHVNITIDMDFELWSLDYQLAR